MGKKSLVNERERKKERERERERERVVRRSYRKVSIIEGVCRLL